MKTFSKLIIPLYLIFKNQNNGESNANAAELKLPQTELKSIKR